MNRQEVLNTLILALNTQKEIDKNNNITTLGAQVFGLKEVLDYYDEIEKYIMENLK